MLLFLLMLPRSPISTLFPYTTLFRSLIEERVGVEAIALEGDKQGAGSQVSGVRGDAAEAESGRRAHAERFRDPRARPLGHEAPSACTIARSSNGCFSVPITW